jgi:hypothetical protein
MSDNKVYPEKIHTCPVGLRRQEGESETGTSATAREVQSSSDSPIVTFYQTIPNAPLPRRANAVHNSWTPAKAVHYCEPFITATEYGWHIFPPVEFSLSWDGRTTYWKPGGEKKWRMMVDAPEAGTPLPGYEELFRKAVPYQDEYLFPISFLNTRNDLPGLVLIFTGLFARTRPEWSLLVRPPANLPRHAQFDVLEGIVETDWWFGPIAAGIRICATNQPIKFSTDIPLFQAQPVPREAYRNATLDSAVMLDGLSNFSPDDWRAYAQARRLRDNPEAKLGSYKAEVRRRAKQEREQR